MSMLGSGSDPVQMSSFESEVGVRSQIGGWVQILDQLSRLCPNYRIGSGPNISVGPWVGSRDQVPCPRSSVELIYWFDCQDCVQIWMSRSGSGLDPNLNVRS